MQQLDVDFDVWKAITALRRDEAHSCNQVLRELLKLPEKEVSTDPQKAGGSMIGGRFLADGTRLRAKYKSQWFHAEIVNGRLQDAEGTIFGSASAAARAVTGTNVNGLLFWSVKRPMDSGWQVLAGLPKR